MAPGHPDYFKLTLFEKWQAQEGISDLSPKHVIRPQCEKDPLYTRRKGASLFSKTEGHQEKSEWAGLAKLTSVTTLSSYPLWSYHIFHDSPLSIKPNIKTLRFNILGGLRFLVKALCHEKLIWNTFICLPPVNLCYRDPAENWKWVEEICFSPLQCLLVAKTNLIQWLLETGSSLSSFSTSIQSISRTNFSRGRGLISLLFV